jgi:hypothetical protein
MEIKDNILTNRYATLVYIILLIYFLSVDNFYPQKVAQISAKNVFMIFERGSVNIFKFPPPNENRQTFIIVKYLCIIF